jgi:hypothetical protein
MTYDPDPYGPPEYEPPEPAADDISQAAATAFAAAFAATPTNATIAADLAELYAQAAADLDDQEAGDA